MDARHPPPPRDFSEGQVRDVGLGGPVIVTQQGHHLCWHRFPSGEAEPRSALHSVGSSFPPSTMCIGEPQQAPEATDHRLEQSRTRLYTLGEVPSEGISRDIYEPNHDSPTHKTVRVRFVSLRDRRIPPRRTRLARENTRFQPYLWSVNGKQLPRVPWNGSQRLVDLPGVP
jgi:hypothetical protein